MKQKDRNTSGCWPFASYSIDKMMKKEKCTITHKPDFPKMFFWDLYYDRIDWSASYGMVIQRILERGMQEHWQELERFYGKDTIITALKEVITFLPDDCIDEVSFYFRIKKEGMLCFKRKQSQPNLWR